MKRVDAGDSGPNDHSAVAGVGTSDEFELNLTLRLRRERRSNVPGPRRAALCVAGAILVVKALVLAFPIVSAIAQNHHWIR